MKARIITSLREFDRLVEVWREVIEAAGQVSPLLTHDWFACCWRTAGANRGRELWIIEDSAGPAALIPLVRSRTRYRGLPTRTVELMRAPDSALVGFPVVRGANAVVMSSFLRMLRERDDWDVFLMPGLRTDSSTWKVFQAAASESFRWRISGRMHIPSVSLSASAPAFQEAVAQLRHAAGSHWHNDAVRVDEYRHLEPGDPLLDEIMDMSPDPWSGRYPGVNAATPQEIRRFYRQLTARASANGWLHLWVARTPDRVVAADYQLAAHGAVHTLRRDPDGRLGKAALRHGLTLSAIERLAERRSARTYFDLPRFAMNGAAGWCASETVFVETFAPRAYPHVLHSVETRLVPLARRLRGISETPCAS